MTTASVMKELSYFSCQLFTGTSGEEAINRHAHEHSDSHARPYKGLSTIQHLSVNCTSGKF